MLGWLRRKPAKARLLRDRILEAVREIAVLLLAFAPLDVAMSRSALRDAIGTLLIFLGIGLFLFAAALAFEWRRADDA